ILSRALGAARKAGASYGDIRVMRRRQEDVSTREDHITNVSYGEDYGFGVRVVADGAWGFAASSRVDPKEAERVAQLAVDIARANARVVKRPVTLAPEAAHVDVWQTPLTKDPFKIPPSDKAELLLAASAEALKVSGVRYASAGVSLLGEWKLLASTDGAYIEQAITRIGPSLIVTAVDSTSGEFTSRAHELPAMQGGWELIENSPLVADARRLGEDAVAKLKSPSVTPGKRDLILAPSNLWLTIHESVGHPTELDRALGYEANMAGTSFATVDKLGKLRYAAPLVTIFADKTTPGGLATCGYDDDGVKTQRWEIVKDGLFVGYQTTREQAGWIGEKASRGCSYAQDYKSFPFQRMPNVSLAPGKKPLGVAELIAATEDGIYITGNGSWSIDHQRYNFQFGGQMFYEVKHGKITRTLKDVAYQSNTLEFWNACDMVGGEKEWAMGGSLFDGKGEPGQVNAVSHGCPPARFRGVNILNTNARGKRA
ncbi:MAG TPA: TldD/PmbA family protein, partial [Polyangia bacterium]|nr:TldD/PmbA family protein [Polyangia bacterium]